jgi:hypothetical protein
MAAVIYEAVISGGLAAAAALAAAGVAALATTKLLDQYVPEMGGFNMSSIPGFEGLQASHDKLMGDYFATQNAMNGNNPAGGMFGGALNAAMVAATNALKPNSAGQQSLDRNTSALERNTQIQEHVADLQKILQGGGTFSENAVSELSIARATNRGGGVGGMDPDLMQAMELIQRYTNNLVAGTQRNASRQMRMSGAG